MTALAIAATLAGTTFAGCGNAGSADRADAVQTGETAATATASYQKITLTVPDMVCPLCANTIEHTLKEAGLRDIDIDLETKLVVARFDPKRYTLDEVKKLVTDQGYSVSDARLN